MSAENNPLQGTHVEWEANFDRPIEQLIYPSLQRFDPSVHKKKKDTLLHQIMSGIYSDHVNEQNTSTPTSYHDSNHLPTYEVEPISSNIEQKMFLVSPKWTIKLSHDNVIRKTLTEKNLKATDKSLIDEIDIDGESYLREKLKLEHMEKLKQDQMEKDLAQSISNTLSIVEIRRARKILQNSNNDNPSLEVYSSIVGSRSNSSQRDLSLPKKLSTIPLEELSYNKHKKYLSTMTPKEQDHLLDGIMYYRVKNDLVKIIDEEKKAVESQHAAVTMNKLSKTKSRNFSVKVGSKKPDFMNSVNSNFDDIEDANTVSISRLNSSLSRVHKASTAKAAGYSVYDMVADSTAEQNVRSAQDELLMLQLGIFINNLHLDALI